MLQSRSMLSGNRFRRTSSGALALALFALVLPTVAAPAALAAPATISGSVTVATVGTASPGGSVEVSVTLFAVTAPAGNGLWQATKSVFAGSTVCHDTPNVDMLTVSGGTSTQVITVAIPSGATTGQLIVTPFRNSACTGGNDFGSAFAETTITVTALLRATSLTGLSCAGGDLVIAQTRSCSVTIADTASGTAVNVTGLVVFATPFGSFGTTSCGTGTSRLCSATLTAASAGTGVVTASYAETATHAAATSVTTALTTIKRTTSTTVACAPGSVAPAGSTTCTATVTDLSGSGTSNPAGAVAWTAPSGSFTNESCVNDGSNVRSCQATFTTSATALVTGTYQATATHLGSSGSSTVSLTPDTTAPVVTVPSNMSVEATVPAGANPTFTASALDDRDGVLTPICTPATGDAFDFGATTVTCSIRDAANNLGSATFTVTVSDTTDPVLSLPTVPTTEAAGPTGATVSYSASATDLGQSVAISCSLLSDSVFSIGITPVNCSATDTAGRTASGSFSVTVVDLTEPVVTAPANMTLEAGVGGVATLTYATPTATDLVTPSSSMTVLCAPGSGSSLAIGVHTVTCSTSDVAGTTGTASFTATVADTVGPVFTTPSTISASTTGTTAAVVFTGLSASDLVSGSATPVCSPASGSAFNVGSTTVSCTATDTAGNSSSSAFTVMVTFVALDTTPPVIAAPSSVVVEAVTSFGATATFSVSAIDAIDGARTVTCTPFESGGSFPMGTTEVTCTASDLTGNVGTRKFDVIVEDTTDPILTLPSSPVLAAATSSSGANVSFTASAFDNISFLTLAICTRTSGSLFAIGDTSVSCTATDLAGNVASGSFVVRVAPMLDTLAPSISTPGALTASTASPSGTVVTFSASALDAVDGPVAVTCARASGLIFPVGATTVTCTAVDAAGNVATNTFTVTVSLADTNAPAIAVPPTVSVVADGPSGKVVTFSASAIDDVDGILISTCSPASGSLFAIGTTTVTCAATDAAGNAGTAQFSVIVSPVPVIPVVDTTAPTIVDPGALNATTTSPFGTVVNFSVSALDTVDGPVVVTCVPAAGSTFPVGTTRVTCVATDAAGNSQTRFFDVVVTLATTEIPAETPSAPAGEPSAPAETPTKVLPNIVDNPDDEAIIRWEDMDGNPVDETTRVPEGTELQFEVSGFGSETSVDVFLESEPLFLKTISADRDGVVQTTVTIPLGTPLGSHHVVLRGVDPAGEDRVTELPITVVAVASLANSSGLWRWAVLALLAGFFFFIVAKRRRDEEEEEEQTVAIRG